MRDPTIQASTRDGILTITLDRPARLNAFNADMCAELDAAVCGAQRDDAVRCLLLTGAGRAFCSGQDLQTVQPGSDGADALDLGAYLRDCINPFITRLRTLEKPVVAAVNGVAAGVGVSLALAADLRICARSTLFKMAFVNIGLVPDGGATLALVQHVGYARAAEMCLLGEPVSAEQALQMGLVNRVVDDAELPTVAREVAARLAALPTRAIGLTKSALNRAWAATLREQLECEASLQAAAACTADHREGVLAFKEKRPARFVGK